MKMKVLCENSSFFFWQVGSWFAVFLCPSVLAKKRLPWLTIDVGETRSLSGSRWFFTHIFGVKTCDGFNIGFIAHFDYSYTSYKVVLNLEHYQRWGDVQKLHMKLLHFLCILYILQIFLKNHDYFASKLERLQLSTRHDILISFTCQSAVQGYNVVGRTICRLLDTENEVRRGQGDLDRDALMDVYLNIFLYTWIYIYMDIIQLGMIDSQNTYQKMETPGVVYF